jgi:hypothetical protein
MVDVQSALLNVLTVVSLALFMKRSSIAYRALLCVSAELCW